MDIGHIRSSVYNGAMLVNDATPFHGDKVIIADVTFETRHWYDFLSTNENRVAGGMFGGTTVAMQRVYREYYATLETNIKDSQYVGNYQIVMFRTCSQNYKICKIPQPDTLSHCNLWASSAYMSQCNAWIYVLLFLPQQSHVSCNPMSDISGNIEIS